MAILPSVKKLNPSDFKEAPAWFTGRFCDTINKFLDAVYNALNASLTFQQNINSQIFTTPITSSTTYPLKFKSTLSGTPVGCLLVAKNVAGNLQTALIQPIEFSWYYTAGVVYITGIGGLTPGVNYNLTFLVF